VGLNAYVLTFAGFLLLGGAPRTSSDDDVYLLGIAIFTIASVGAGFAESGGQMVAIRAIQGLGGAILCPRRSPSSSRRSRTSLPKAIGA